MTPPTSSLPFPKVVRIEPAGACNLACSHCPTGTVDMPRGVMPRKTFERVLAAIQRNLDQVKVVVLYHGGEPMLNRQFPDMVKDIKALGSVFIKTVSNGMLLPDEPLEAIIRNGLDWIEFSLDGQSREESNTIRRNGDYDTVVGNIKRAIALKRRLGSKTPQIYISSTQFIDPATHRRGDIPPIPQHLVQEFAAEGPDAIAGYKTHYAMHWPEMKVDPDVYEIYQDPQDTETRSTCDYTESTITVRWNGDVVPCCYDLTSGFVCGNIDQEELETIWINQRYARLRDSIRDRRFVKICNNCNVVKPHRYLLLKHRSPAKVLA